MSNDFERKKVESLTLGEKLASLRKDHQVTLNEFSRHTKIQKKYVEALEIGDYEVLPSAVYVRGFIRSYESYFGLSDGVLVKQFDREYQIHENISQKDSTDPFVDYKKSSFFSQYVITPRLLFAVGVLAFIGGIGVYIYRDVDQFLQAPPLTVQEPISGESVDTSQVTVVGTTHPEAFLYLNDEILPVDTDGTFEESVSLSSGENILVIRSEGKSGQKTEQKIIVFSSLDTENLTETDDSSSSEVESGRQSAPAREVVLLTLVARERVFVRVLTDGVGVFDEILEEGSEKTFEATENIIVTAGVGNALTVTHNEKDFGTLSDTEGPVNDIEFGLDYNTLSSVDEESLDAESEAGELDDLNIDSEEESSEGEEEIDDEEIVEVSEESSVEDGEDVTSDTQEESE